MEEHTLEGRSISGGVRRSRIIPQESFKRIWPVKVFDAQGNLKRVDEVKVRPLPKIDPQSMQEQFYAANGYEREEAGL